MKVRKAVITAAEKNQRALPLQTLIDRDGQEKSVLRILVEQALGGGVDEVCIVTWPGDEGRYTQALGRESSRVRFVAQPEPLGYADAVYCGRGFTAGEPFVHMVGDHLYVSDSSKTCTQQVVELAEREECAVSAVQATRETQLHMFGAVGGRRHDGRADTYRIETVVEKPTPTEAEQRLISPGLRAGHYLCFFGIHVLPPEVMDILGRRRGEADGPVTLSGVLDELAHKEQYLALENAGRRYDIGARYGVLTAQMALALSGPDRGEVLEQLLELLADRDLKAAAARSAE